jgi:hypothetical protein
MVLTNSDLNDAYEGFERAVELLDQQHDLILKLRADRRDTHDAEVNFGTMRRTLVGKLRTGLGLPPLGQSTQVRTCIRGCEPS